MATTAPDVYGIGLGALTRTDHRVVRRLSHYQIGRSERACGKGLGPEGTGLLPADQQQSETAPAVSGEAAAGLDHRESLALSIVGSAAANLYGFILTAPRQLHPVPVQEARGDIRRNRVQMRAEDQLRPAPAEKQVQTAVPDLHHIQLRSRPILCEEFRQLRCKRKRELPFLSGSGVRIQQASEKLKVHSLQIYEKLRSVGECHLYGTRGTVPATLSSGCSLR